MLQRVRDDAEFVTGAGVIPVAAEHHSPIIYQPANPAKGRLTVNIDDYRHWAHVAADWSADYLDSVRERPVRAQTAPGEILEKLPASPPEAAEDVADIFADLDDVIMPGITHWQHPRFFAYFPANSSPPSVIAETLTAAIAAQCMLWQTSPAATELEIRVMDWMRQMIGLPEGFHGVIQDSASSATLCAVLTGRERALEFTGNTKGLADQPATRVYCSDQAHSSIDKAVWIAGVGQQNLVKIPTAGPKRAMDVAELEAAIQRDKADGKLPAMVMACIGATGVGASDDIAAVAEICERNGVYLHVDAAWAGAAMICADYRAMMAGAERADSFVFNAHKWLATNFDCSVHLVRNPDDLVRTLAIRPDYLKTHGQDGVINFSEWSVPLGRRFRALKLWFVVRAFGVETLRQMIRNHVQWAHDLAAKIDAAPEFELTSKPVLSLFSFRYAPEGVEDLDGLNTRLLTAINDDGRIYLTPTAHDGKSVIRFNVGQTSVTEADVVLAWEVIREVAGRIAPE